MSTAILPSPSMAVSSFPDTKVAGKPRLSLREWLDVFGSALAMASTVPTTGRANAKQLARVRALAESL